MRTSHCTIRQVVRSQGPEWAVYCDGAYLDQFGTLGEARRSAIGASADSGVYRTVLQVLDMSAMPMSTETITATAAAPVHAEGREPRRDAGARATPPRSPGDKPREYPHSSGDRNTLPPVQHPDKDTHEGGKQRVAPTDLPQRDPGAGRSG